MVFFEMVRIFQLLIHFASVNLVCAEYPFNTKFNACTWLTCLILS